MPPGSAIASPRWCRIPAPLWWWIAVAIAAGLAALTPIGILYLITTGVGVWGENNSANWAWDITNFVFWIGIGHAGTMIAAILYLTRQKWASGINRAAEAMTIFAVMCAGIYPGVHVGRVWFAWYLAPIPNANAIWPNFRSPLLWDVFACLHLSLGLDHVLVRRADSRRPPPCATG